MRSTVMIVAVLGMAACTPVVPDSGAGVGFQDYNSYQQTPPVAAAPTGGFSPAAAAAAIDAAEGKAPLSAITPAPAPVAAAPAGETRGIVIGSGQRPRGNAPAGIQETTSEMTGVAGSAAVSDENDFAAVSARETIESDKARIERNRAQYQVDQPGALPQRTGGSEPNIVQYALSTSHAKGTQMYKRGGIHLTGYGAACAKYPSPDLAQEAFLAAGGPERDRLNVDPDGDGFACAWDPTPFRTALQ